MIVLKVKLNLVRGDILLVFLLLICANLLLAQTSNKNVQFQEAYPADILANIEDQFQVIFNYNPDVLPNQTFTLSTGGSLEEILTVVFSAMNREFKQLEPNVFVVKNEPIASNKRIDPIKIRIKILDEHELPLPFCNMWCEAIGRGWESDPQGIFSMEGYFHHSDKLTISYVGYKNLERPVSFFLKQPTVSLTPASYTLGEIVVTDKKLRINNLSDQTDIDPNAFEKTGTAERDVLSIAQFVPGIANATGSLNDLQIRGGPPDQTSVKWNGIRIYQNSHFYGKISSINPFLVDKMVISKNGVANQRQGTSPGEISLSNGSRQQDSTKVKIHSNLLNTNIGLSTPIVGNQLSLTVAYRRSYTDFFQSWVYDKFFNQSFQAGVIDDDKYYRNRWGLDETYEYYSIFDFSDLGGTIHYRPSNKDYLKASFIRTKNSLAYNTDHKENGDQIISSLIMENVGLNLMYQRNWNDQHSTEVSMGKSGYSYDYDFRSDEESNWFAEEDNTDNQVDQYDVFVKQTYTQGNVQFDFGGELTYWDSHFANYGVDDGEFRFVDSFFTEANELRFYSNFTWKPSKKFQLSSGLKYSFYSLREEEYIEPKFHLSYRPIESLEIHANYGKYHQNLNRRTFATPLQAENGFWMLSDQSDDTDFWIFSVENEQYSVGLQYGKSNFKLGLDYFRKKVFNLFTAVYEIHYEEDPYQFSDLIASGFEFSTQYRYNDYFALLSYTYTKEHLMNEWDVDFRSPYNQPHRLQIFQSYRFKRFNVGMTWRFASGRYYSNAAGFGLVEDEDGGDPYYRTEFNELFTEQVPNFHQLDLSFNYEFGLRQPKIQAVLGAHITNVYNRQNILRIQYGTDWKPDTPEVGLLQERGLPFTPNLSLDIVF